MDVVKWIRLPQHRDRLVSALILLLAIASQFPLFRGQFDGEDETLQLHTVTRILNALRDWQVPASLFEIIGALSTEPHPPLRFLISLPGVALLPGTELGLRLGAIILSVAMTWMAMSWGEALRGRAGRWIAGLYVATSGVYNWTSMAFAWSAICVCLFKMFIILKDASCKLADPAQRRVFHRLNLLCILMFLVSTGSLLFTVGLGLVYLRHNRPATVVRASLPHVGFYAAYYLYILVAAPWAYQLLTKRPLRSGQVTQNVARAGDTGLGLTSLGENLAGLNAYLLPFVSWLLLGFGAYVLWGTRKDLLLLVAPCVVAWSLVLRGATQQYFLLAVLPVIVTGVVTLFAVPRRSRVARTLATAGLVAILGSQALWNWHVFIRSYTETTYPWSSLRRFYALAERVHNIVHPYPELARDLDRLMKPDERIASEVGGSFFMFYYNDNPRRLHHSRLARHLSEADFRLDATHCFRLITPVDPSTVVVLSRRTLCADQFRELREYPGSHIKLYLLAPNRSALDRGHVPNSPETMHGG